MTTARRTCTKCGERARIVNTNVRADGVYRQYRCPTSRRHGWWTIEKHIDDQLWYAAEKAKHLAALERLVFLVPREFA